MYPPVVSMQGVCPFHHLVRIFLCLFHPWRSSRTSVPEVLHEGIWRLDGGPSTDHTGARCRSCDDTRLRGCFLHTVHRCILHKWSTRFCCGYTCHFLCCAPCPSCCCFSDELQACLTQTSSSLALARSPADGCQRAGWLLLHHLRPSLQDLKSG